MNQVQTGFLRGTGAEIHVSTGFIPDHVRVINVTDGDKIYENNTHEFVAFSSGSVEVQAGDLLKSAGGARGRIHQVLLDSGSWAGGDAAGWLVFEHEELSGTFGAETAGVVLNEDDTPADELTLPGAAGQDGVDVDTEVAGTTDDATTIRAYLGSTTAGVGFTVGATISEDGKLLQYVAFRNSEGGGPIAQA